MNMFINILPSSGPTTLTKAGEEIHLMLKEPITHASQDCKEKNKPQQIVFVYQHANPSLQHNSIIDTGH